MQAQVAPFTKQNSESEEKNPALGNASTPSGLTKKEQSAQGK